MESIVAGAKEPHRVTRADLDSRRHMDDLLLKQGFSFDVFYDEEHDKCELVELNVFGIRSGCGSCLFHWVVDRARRYLGRITRLKTGVQSHHVKTRLSSHCDTDFEETCSPF